MADERKQFDARDAVDSVYWRDEILQLVYWMAGEGFGSDFCASDLTRFLETEEAELGKILERMASDGFLQRAGPGRYALTPVGREEGGRRFADEFDSMLKPGHFECDEPDCDCHRPESSGECKNLSPGRLTHEHL